MNRFFIFCLSLCSILYTQAYAQTTFFTFHVEDLKAPIKLLSETDSAHVLNLVYKSYVQNGTKNLNFNTDAEILSNGNISPKLVNFGVHSFYEGMHKAYAEHRPFTLSPDMIWLLISQGFAQHINNNAEQLRSKFVRHSSKLSLITTANNPTDIYSKMYWEKTFQIFNDQIGKTVGPNLIDVLSCNFSTSTPTTNIASQITIMESLKAYFEYVVIYTGCGIPDITLEGTPEDWEKVRTKAQYLKQYDLAWWIDQLDPILKEFVQASKHKVSKKFWKIMFKGEEGAVYKIGISDGWIVKFFPYDKEGHRNNLKAISSADQLPPEVTKTAIKYVSVDTSGRQTIDTITLWAGFVGLEQNAATYGLKPQISWMVTKGNVDNKISNTIKGILQSKKESRLEIKVNSFPDELLSIPYIKFLNIRFTDSIRIPDAISNIKIDDLSLFGDYTIDEVKKIHQLLPNTQLFINNTEYQEIIKQKQENPDSARIRQLHASYGFTRSYLNQINAEINIPKGYQQIETKYLPGNLNYGSSALLAYENNSFVVEYFGDGIFFMDNNTLTEERSYRDAQMRDMIESNADKDFPITKLSSKELNNINADDGYIFNKNISLNSNDKYSLCKVLLLKKTDLCFTYVYILYKDASEEKNVMKEIKKNINFIHFKKDSEFKRQEESKYFQYYGKYQFVNQL